ETGDTGDVATGMRQAGHEPKCNRVRRCAEDDWDSACCLARLDGCGCSGREDCVRPTGQEAHDQVGEAVPLVLGVQPDESQIAAFHPTEFAHPLEEREVVFASFSAVLVKSTPTVDNWGA